MMKNLYLAFALLIGSSVFGQIEQHVNTTAGTESNMINQIDSIRFNEDQTEMQIVLMNGNIEIHSISDINNVTFSGVAIGEIEELDCAGATANGILIVGIVASDVSAEVSYTGGNGGAHNGQVVVSTGVTGLTATLVEGTFANGAGSLIYSITGTPTASGTADFALEIGGLSCSLTFIVNSTDALYPPGSVFCASGPAIVVDVTNPTTGKIWMDRNLGATQVAVTSTNSPSFGDLYQWGRGSDGHQCRTSPSTSVLSSTDQPGHGSFITVCCGNTDWRSPPNTNLWQGVNGVNNPCPSGYRVPTSTEWNEERLSWSSTNANGAFASPLKLTMAGNRAYSGSLLSVSTAGLYWSSTVFNLNSRHLEFTSSSYLINYFARGNGKSVRCIKD